MFDYINTKEDFLYITENGIQAIIYLGTPNNKHYKVALSDGKSVDVIFVKDIGLIDGLFNVYSGSLATTDTK